MSVFLRARDNVLWTSCAWPEIEKLLIIDLRRLFPMGMVRGLHGDYDPVRIRRRLPLQSEILRGRQNVTRLYRPARIHKVRHEARACLRIGSARCS